VVTRGQALGAEGEELVARRYRALGYRVVDRNWRCPQGELDLVLRKGRTLVVCEVKTRSSPAYGLPAEAVTAEKQRRLRAATLRYLAASRLRPRVVRFDVAAVLDGRVEILEAAL
jgi:putative endonuclease